MPALPTIALQLAQRGPAWETNVAEGHRAALTAIFIMCGIMLGSGLGAAFGNVAIGITGGMAIGGLIAILFNISRR